MGKLTDRIEAMAAPLAAEAGCTVWDVEYIKEAGNWYLRVYLDRPEGVDLNCCETVSRRLSDLLDEEDPIPDSYILEVSSPGAERVLRRPADFQRFLGEMVRLRLYRAREGRKELTGRLIAHDEDAIIIDPGDGEVQLPMSEVAQVRLYVEW
ncbi:MAG: ribosome maturation factor RimP [Oscillospiraceae bacterium]|nr:ribosome maturation factor RimP [Oscillospiraceae bacterium]